MTLGLSRRASYALARLFSLPDPGDGNGDGDGAGLAKWFRASRLHHCGRSYSVVYILAARPKVAWMGGSSIAEKGVWGQGCRGERQPD
jgi:hypothetical protein